MSTSQVPVYVLAGFGVAALILLSVAVWIGVRLRGSTDRFSRVVQAVMVGVAVAFLVLLLAGQRHYGGTVHEAAGRVSACDAWYFEAGLPSSRPALQGDLSPHCRHDAIAAIAPALGLAAAIGVVVGVLFFVLGWAWRRRRAGRRARSGPSTTRYVDS